MPLSLDHFRRQLEVGLTAGTFQVVKNGWDTVGRRFRHPDIAGNDSAIYLVTHERSHIIDDLGGQIVAPVIHGQNNTLDRETGVERATNLIDRLQQLA